MKKILLTTMTFGMLGFTSYAQDASSTDPQITAPPSGMEPTDHPFEAGAIFGEPTALSLKYWVSDTMAVDGGLGWSLRHEDDDLYLHSDLLWHNFDLFKVSKGQLPLYFGVGGRVDFRDGHDDLVGIRIPVGINYLFADAPVSLFFEVAPVIDVSPDVRGDINVGIGARYRF